MLEPKLSLEECTHSDGAIRVCSEIAQEHMPLVDSEPQDIFAHS